MEESSVQGSSFEASQGPGSSLQSQSLPPRKPTFLGNSNDVLAIVAVTLAGTTALCCLSWGYGIYCLPVVALVLGGVALLNAQSSVDPERTRRLGWISIGTGGVVLGVIIVLMLCVVLFYVGMFATMFATMPNVSTPVPRFK